MILVFGKEEKRKKSASSDINGGFQNYESRLTLRECTADDVVEGSIFCFDCRRYVIGPQKNVMTRVVGRCLRFVVFNKNRQLSASARLCFRPLLVSRSIR